MCIKVALHQFTVSISDLCHTSSRGVVGECRPGIVHAKEALEQSVSGRGNQRFLSQYCVLFSKRFHFAREIASVFCERQHTFFPVVARGS